MGVLSLAALEDTAACQVSSDVQTQMMMRSKKV